MEELLVNGRKEASSVLGWLSIGCWLVVYSPQLLENYQRKSGEGLSVAFIIAWTLGDLFNLFGSIRAGLLPTVIILASYYTLCDLTLLVQIYYYRIFYDSHNRACAPDESTPLIPPKIDSDKPGPKKSMIVALLERESVKYSLLALFVVCFGVLGYLRDRHPSNNTPHNDIPQDHIFEWRSQLMGWASAILYLGARIPQIAKNLKTRCEGLSLALFLFAISGNTFFVLSVCTISLDWEYIRVNASWLVGSGFCVFADVYILVQFFRFRIADRERLAAARVENNSSA
ncbi:PQ-loop-domain-containing protein [Cantharellus anzutake]|uniref:PQ-loop-domain-containing protein n=1 Tax=Cantharellus anzutake TaxID=1750568 RepID=UPI0019049954|nr:PQ-loop-domain-containing protein [Cantharellus anzutake]KAF8341487.1 PQ-loop-domain-containing protein [Cantharellus anzutake]